MTNKFIENWTINIFDDIILDQPKDDQILWRYIKKDRIDDFLNGEVYFSRLSQFNDYYEGITPFHLMLLQFIKRSAPWYYQQGRAIQELQTNDSYINRLRLYTDNFLIDNELKMLNSNLASLLEENDQEKLKIILDDKIANFNLIQNDHIKNQRRTLSSCWFLSNLIESALMWNSYSEPGGIAVFIPFENFKRSVCNFFNVSALHDTLKGIKTVKAGLIKYHHYYLTNEWLENIKKNIPLAFFKHISYKNEQEYRIVMEVDDENAEQKYNLFCLMDNFQIILHPSATHLDMDMMRDRVKGRLHVKFSELSYTIS